MTLVLVVTQRGYVVRHRLTQTVDQNSIDRTASVV